jgi:gamma-butyrobetaine dioxygenase
MTPPEHIRPLSTSRPQLELGPETNTNIEAEKSDIAVEIDGERHQFDCFFLRDACSCPKCVDPSTQQKLFSTTDLPADVLPRAVRIKNKGALEVVWNHPEDHPHVSFYEPEFLLRYSTAERRRHFRFPVPQQIYWDGEMMRENLLKVDYDAFLKDDLMLHKVLVQLHLYGLALFVNVPSENTDGTEIANLATRIGEIKQTFYGRTWDVKSVAQSKNIA